MTCKYKVKIKDIQYNYKVQMTDIQSKYKFKVFCTGYDDSEIKDKIDAMYEAWPKASGEGETITLNDTANTTMTIDLKGNTSQEGTPTPEAPQDIHVVSGDNSIDVMSKNILHLSNTSRTNGGITGTITNDNILTYSGTANRGYADITVAAARTLQAGTYTFSIDQPRNVRVILYENNRTHIIAVGETKITFNISQDTPGYYYVGISGMTNGTSYSGTIKMQLEKNSSKTEYEPYQSQSYPINLGDIELCKIGDYQDTIVKDNGKWYLNKQIGKVVLNGSETISNYAPTSLTGSYQATFETITKANSTDKIVLSDYFTSALLSERTTKTNICYTYTDGLLRIATNVSTTTEGFKTWLSTHNTNVYYVLATPTYTEITDSTLISQLEAIKEAESYSGQTNISQTNYDKPFILTAKALKDLSNL